MKYGRLQSAGEVPATMTDTTDTTAEGELPLSYPLTGLIFLPHRAAIPAEEQEREEKE